LKFVRLSLIFFLLPLSVMSQSTNGKHTRNDYYIFPIKPGQRNGLSGTMGELRSNHFHAGLDIRTEGRTGLPVHAAAEGYISRISVSRGGYGNALYIAHPNGTTTVYAHLDEFKGPVADYVREMQYEKQSFELTLYFKPGEFSVKQGDVVALSGNSGSSGGPHVHFDLRDKNQDLLNPLQFGFDEIIDTTPPEAEKIAFRTLDKEARVYGKFGRFEYTLERSGNDYRLTKPVEVYGSIGMELYAFDRLDNTRFRHGINYLEVIVDGKVTYSHDISTFAFSDQRNILMHMDYAQNQQGERFHKLYIDDGNYLRFYTTDSNKGKLHAAGNREVPVEISMRDTYGNSSKIFLTLKFLPPEAQSSNGSMFSEPGNYLRDNTMIVAVPSSESSNTVTVNSHALSPDYKDGNLDIYLWDIREELPAAIVVNGVTSPFSIDKAIYPLGNSTFSRKEFSLSFPSQSLFDTLYLHTDYSVDSIHNREYFAFGNSDVPLRNSITVTLKPGMDYPDREKVVAYALDDQNNAYYAGGEWSGDRFIFTTRDFGRYTLLADEQAPSIQPVRLTRNSLQFKIDDALSGINSFDCYVNGQWVLMYYDYKRKLLWSEKKTVNMNFSGEVKLVVRDNVNNQKEYTTKID